MPIRLGVLPRRITSALLLIRYKWVIRLAEIEMHTRLGAGAYGEVWAGRWRRNEVAVKSLLRSSAAEVRPCCCYFIRGTLRSDCVCAGRWWGAAAVLASESLCMCCAAVTVVITQQQSPPQQQHPQPQQQVSSGKDDFLNEMTLLSELRHPNIVRFLGACLDAQVH